MNNQDNQQSQNVQRNPQNQNINNSNNQSNHPNPSLLRINIDDQDKRKICIFWSVLIIFILIIAILASFVIPRVFIPNDRGHSTHSTNLQNCPNPNLVINDTVFCNINDTRSIGQLFSRWDQYNQFILVYLQIKPNDITKRIVFNQKFTFELYQYDHVTSMNSSTKLVKIRDRQMLQSILQFDSDNADKLYAQDQKTVVGYLKLYIAITELTQQKLYIKTNFSSTSNFTNIKLNTLSYAVNKKYTDFTIIIRYVFFVISIITCILYFKRNILISKQKLIIQQRYIFVISILLIAFNDPFYIVTILKPNGVSAFFSIMFIMNLVVFLIYFWIIVIRRIYKQDGVLDTQPIQKKVIIYSIILWLMLIIVNMIYAMQQINKHPAIPYHFSRQFQGAAVIVGIVVFLGIAWIAMYYIKILMAQDNKLWRSNIFMSLSAFVIVLLFILIITNSLSIYNYKGSTILFVYCLINMYIYYLQFMFSITNQEVEKIKNPHLQDDINFIEMASTGTIDIVDVNLSDFNPHEKREYNFQERQDQEIFYKNTNKNKGKDNKDGQIEIDKEYNVNFDKQLNQQQNQQIQTQNIGKQNQKDQVQSLDFD